MSSNSLKWRRPGAILGALLLPPVAVYYLRGGGPAFFTNIGLSILAQAVFWGAFALPGLVLWGVSVIHGLMVTVFLEFQPVRNRFHDA